MSGLKTLSLGLAMTFLMAGAAQALDDLTREFAYCTGRYSAEMEHAWLVNDPDAEEQAARRASFVSLLEAVAPSGSGPVVLNHRISAKVAQAALLARATFDDDPEIRRQSRAQASHLLKSCEGFLLRG